MSVFAKFKTLRLDKYFIEYFLSVFFKDDHKIQNKLTKSW